MDKNQSMWRYRQIGILMLALCVVATAANITCLALAVPLKLKLGAGVGLLGCACSLYYMFHGYRKNAAAAYRAFLVIMFVTFQFMAATINIEIKVVATIISMLACLKASFALVLAVSNNTGVKFAKSMILTIAILATIELFVAIAFIPVPGAARGGTVTIVAGALRAASNLFVAWMGYSMTCAKYRDKVERGTK